MLWGACGLWPAWGALHKVLQAYMSRDALNRSESLAVKWEQGEKNPWFAVRTRARAEKVASQQIRALSIEEFLPLYHVRRQWFDRVKKVSLPLFSGYLFCRCNREMLWRVSSLSSVADVVGFGDESAIIPEHEIQAIRQLVESGLSVSPCPFLREGTMVRIRGGPLMDVTGRLLKIKSDYRLVISVEMLNRSVSVEVSPEIIQQI